MLATIGVLGGMLGATLVALNRPYYANVVWLVANPLLIAHNTIVGEYEQSAMYMYYMAVATLGVAFEWRRRKNMRDCNEGELCGKL